MKTSLDLDRELWLKFRAACVERGLKTGAEVERLMREQLALWAKERKADGGIVCRICGKGVDRHLPDGYCNDVEYAGGQRWSENLSESDENYKAFAKRWQRAQERASTSD